MTEPRGFTDRATGSSAAQSVGDAFTPHERMPMIRKASPDMQVQIVRSQTEVRGEVTHRRGAKGADTGGDLAAELLAKAQAAGGTITITQGSQTITVQAPTPSGP